MKTDLFTGSFENREELCREFGLQPAADAILLSRGFEKAGSAFLLQCSGLFSFVITDEENGCRYCGRDRFGGKGLYYSFDEKQNPIFSETIAGLLSQGKKAELNEEMLEVYLSYSYLPGEETAWKGIRKPLPGCCYCFHGAAVSKERYFIPSYRSEERTEEEWERLLSDALDEIFAAREKGGASMLSSGIDSSYLCKRLSIEHTYTATYENEAFSEAAAAADFSEKIGARPHAVLITPEGYLSSIRDTMRALEQPTGDASAEILLAICRAVKKDGNKSCCSGEGIDELFLGYYMYSVRRISEWTTLRAMDYIGSTGLFTEEDKQRLLRHYSATRKMEATEEAYMLSSREDAVRQAQLIDLMVWLNGNLLPNIFGMEHATGLQLVAPYLDNRLYDLALGIPSALQNDSELTKKLFRKAAGRILDPEHAAMPKRGFPVPIQLWIRRADYEKELKRAFTSPGAERFFRTEELLARYDNMAACPEDSVSWRELWCIYCFLIWHEEMIEKWNGES